MKKIYLSLSIAAVSGILFFSTQKSVSNPSQPPSGRSGAPGENTCATSTCHNGSNITPTDQVSFTAAEGTGAAVDALGGIVYHPDSSYTLTLTVNNLTGRYGFEASCRKVSDNTSSGTITVTDATHTKLQSAGGVTYIGHKNAGSTNSFSWKWKAPAAGADTLRWYFAAMAANNNNNESGDIVYKTNSTFTEYVAPDTTPSAISMDANALNLQIANNLSQDGRFHISFESMNSSDLQLGIYSLNGACLYNHSQAVNAGLNQYELQIPSARPGVYLVHIMQDGKVGTAKVVVK